MFGSNTAYSFKDKDPICDVLRTACAPYSLKEVSKASGVPVGTLWGVFFGATISPRYCTVARIVKGLAINAAIGVTLAEYRRRSKQVAGILTTAKHLAHTLEKH